MANGSNGNGLSGLPTWARVIATLGLPAVAAAWLIYHTTVVQAEVLADIQGKVTTQESLLISIRDGLRDLTRVSRNTCLNTATTPDQASRCFQ